MATQFNGSEGSMIPPAQAAKWTKTYRDANPGEIKAFYIGRDVIEDIFKQADCMGIRMYRAITDDETPQEQVVIVGVDSNGIDLTDNGKIADRCLPCPACCDTNSILYK